MVENNANNEIKERLWERDKSKSQTVWVFRNVRPKRSERHLLAGRESDAGRFERAITLLNRSVSITCCFRRR